MTLRVTSVVLGSALLSLAAIPSAMALDHHGERGHGGRGFGQLLRAADTNEDQSISWDELEDLQREVFTYRDRNGDGYLSLEDRGPVAQRLHARADGQGNEGRSHRRGHRMAQIDSDGDQRISFEEISAHHRDRFNQLDSDQDGVVTREEMRAARAEHRENRRGRQRQRSVDPGQ